MKKRWEKPCVLIQQFAANEYVSTCWQVGCSSKVTYNNQTIDAPYGDKWSNTEGPFDISFSHGGSCAYAGNNYFQADGSNIRFEYENSSDQGSLSGGFDYWEDVNNNGTVDSNDVVYWHTTNGERRWNHWGYVAPVDPKHKNRS